VQGSTVTAIGKHKGLKQARNVVMDCMNNIHPIYNIKTMMIKRELMSNPELKDESWDRFLPKFKKANIKQKKAKIKPKKEKPLFPPEPTMSKVDLQLESGEYFLKQEEKKAIKDKKRVESQKANTEKSQAKRAKAFVAPDESTAKVSSASSGDVDVEALKRKLKAGKKEKKTSEKRNAVSDFVLGGGAVKEKKEKKKKRDKSDEGEAEGGEKKKKKKKHDLL
jgi:ribosomal RNA assembly protein